MRGEGPPYLAPHAAYRARTTFGSLDGLRALSITAVIWHHTVFDEAIRSAIPAARFGFLGVDLFFVISGFLIVTLLLRERERKNHISLGNFYVRRALRIFPLYYGMLGAFGLLFMFRHSDAAPRFFADLPWLVTYTTNWHDAAGMMSITWSLSAEEQFYAIWPPLERYAARFALPVLLVLLVASQILPLGLVDGTVQHVLGWKPDEPRMLREPTFTPILLGVLLAHTLHRPAAFERVRALLGARAIAPLALLAIIVVAELLPTDIRGWPRLSMHVLLLLLVASCVVREDHGLARLLRLPALMRVGTLSYGLYLLHHLGIGSTEAALRRLHVHFPLDTFVLGFAASLLLAELSYRFYEARFLALKARWH